MTAVIAPKSWLLTFFWPSTTTNNRNITPPQTHITFIMPRPKGIGGRHKSGTGKNQGRQLTTHCDNG